MKRDPVTITHGFQAMMEARGEAFVEADCGALFPFGQSCHEIAKSGEAPTCPGCVADYEKRHPPRKWWQDVDHRELLQHAYQVVEVEFGGAGKPKLPEYEPLMNGLARAARLLGGTE